MSFRPVRNHFGGTEEREGLREKRRKQGGARKVNDEFFVDPWMATCRLDLKGAGFGDTEGKEELRGRRKQMSDGVH